VRTIWKYHLEVEDKQTIEVPWGAVPISLQTQFEIPCVWVDVPYSDTELKSNITFLTFGTGHPIEGNMDYYTFLGTYQLTGGSLIFHVFYNIR